MEIPKLDIDLLRQQVPAWFYKRFDLTAGGTKFDYTIPIDYGFGYLLRSINTKWPEMEGETLHSKYSIEFIITSRGRILQNVPYPIRLISTPAEVGVTVNAAPVPVDNDIFSVCFKATPVKNRILLNYYYQYRETIYIRIDTIFSTELNYFDLVLDGYYIPEKILDLWK